MKYRENIEWVNYWWEEANKDRKRVLLIGDSVTRQFRGNFSKLLLEKCGMVADLFASSASVQDVLLLKEIKNFFDTSDYVYDIIILQLGGHHGHQIHCKDNESDASLFSEGYEKMLDFLTNLNNAVCVIAGNTPEALPEQLDTLNDEKNREILFRNQIIKNLGEKRNIPYFDSYSLMIESEFQYMDFVHFERDADIFVAEALFQFLKEGHYI